MEELSSLPLTLNCSRCEHLLVEAFLTIESPTPVISLIVQVADLVCPECKTVLQSAIDDISRMQEEEWHAND